VRETKVEGRLIERVEALGGYCIKLNPLWYVGIPDRLVLLPGGRVIFVETKAPDGTPRKKQLWWREKLVKLGFTFAFLYTPTNVDIFIDSLGYSL
jgi:hypothetical protein